MDSDGNWSVTGCQPISSARRANRRRRCLPVEPCSAVVVRQTPPLTVPTKMMLRFVDEGHSLNGADDVAIADAGVAPTAGPGPAPPTAAFPC